MSWLPFYLVHERHLSATAMAWTAGIHLRDRFGRGHRHWENRGPAHPARCKCVLSPQVADGRRSSHRRRLAARAALWQDRKPGSPCLVGAAVGCGTAGSGIYAVPQTLAGPRIAGRWVGMQNCVANIAGILAPMLTGVLVQRTGHFSAALMLAAAFAAVGALAWVFGVRFSDEPKPLPEIALAQLL